MERITRYNIEEIDSIIIKDNQARSKRELVKRCIKEKISLKRAILPSVDLKGIDFEKINLSKAYLNGCDIRDSNLSNANIKGISLKRCHICNTIIDINQAKDILEGLGFVIK